MTLVGMSSLRPKCVSDSPKGELLGAVMRVQSQTPRHPDSSCQEVPFATFPQAPEHRGPSRTAIKPRHSLLLPSRRGSRPAGGPAGSRTTVRFYLSHTRWLCFDLTFKITWLLLCEKNLGEVLVQTNISRLKEAYSK